MSFPVYDVCTHVNLSSFIHLSSFINIILAQILAYWHKICLYFEHTLAFVQDIQFKRKVFRILDK